MTDATAGRGGVGIRLYIQGGEVVRRTFNQVGDSGKKMWAEIALGEKSANPAIRALSIGAGEVRQKFDGLISRAGSAGAALGAFGALGLGAAAALGALAIAIQGTFAAMSDAAALTDTADRIGISVEALQQWRYVADEVGVETGTLDGVMEKLNGTLGRFKLGIADGKLKPVFEELGITPDQLKNVQTADQLLLMLADTLGQVEDRSKQVALARSLGMEEALPLIRLGREELERLTGAASELGLVLDQDTNKRLDEADRKFELAGQQMKIIRDTAVAPLADGLADITGELAGMAVEFSRIEAKMPGWIQGFLALGRALPGYGVIQRSGEFVLGKVLGSLPERGTAWASAAGVTDDGTYGVDVDDPALRRQAAAVAAIQERGGYQPQGHSDASAASAAASAARQRKAEADRLAREAERAAATLDRDHAAAKRDVTRERWSGDTAEDRAQLAKSLMALDQEERTAKRAALRAELERTGALTEAAKIQLEQLAAMDEEADGLRDRQILETQRREIAARQLEQEKVAAEDAIALIDIEGQMARTAGERYRLARRILLLEQEIEAKTRRAAMDEDGVVSEDERRSYDSLIKRQQGEVRVLDANEDERLREQFKSYGREVSDAIKDGRLGEYIGDQLKQRLLDGALDQLFNAMKAASSGGSGGLGGGSGWISAAMNAVSAAFGGGRAGGGDVRAGFRYSTVEHGRPELLMLGGQGQVSSAADTARMLKESMGMTTVQQSSAPALHQTFKFDNRGAVMTSDLLSQMEQMSASSMTSSFTAARQTVPSDMAKSDRYTRGRRR